MTHDKEDGASPSGEDQEAKKSLAQESREEGYPASIDEASSDEDDSTSTNNDDSSLFLNPNSSMDQADAQGISLLRQIFPGESTEALRDMHYHHLHKNMSTMSTNTNGEDNDENKKLRLPHSPLGKRIFRSLVSPSSSSTLKDWQHTQLPESFLRLPPTVAVRRAYPHTTYVEDNHHNDNLNPTESANRKTTTTTHHHTRYEFVSDLQQRALQELLLLGKEDYHTHVEYYSAVIDRHGQVGLGLTLKEEPPGSLKVVGFVQHEDNPSLIVGSIRLNDVLFGINGSALLFPNSDRRSSSGGNPLLMQQTKQAIHASPNPVVLHFQRLMPPPVERATSLLDTISMDEAPSFTSGASTTTSSSIIPKPKKPSSPTIHPYAKALSQRGLIRSKQDEQAITRNLQQFTERTRQWEATSSFRITDTRHNPKLVPHFDPKDLPPDMADMILPTDYSAQGGNNTSSSSSYYTPSTPPLPHDSSLIPLEYLHAFYGEAEAVERFQIVETRDSPFYEKPSMYPGRKSNHKQTLHNKPPDIFIPLFGVRKALSARIVNTFVEATRVAYTIWVYDIESGKEWYAPIRYFQDFCELRAATLALAPNHAGIAEWDFPRTHKAALVFFAKREADEPDHVRQAKCRQLEHFVRNLCSMVYTCHPLHPALAEISIHVQSFLGVEAGLAETELDQLPKSSPPGHDAHQWKIRGELKKSIQRYTWRLFLLNTMRAIVNDFVNAARARGPKLQDIESLEVRATLKTRAMADLERIQAFLDQLVDLILEGCSEELESLAGRREYFAIRELLDDEVYWDRLIREAVREQVEIEVYVPLRSVVSRLLVNGWRHEDMEVQFKIKELSKRPQGVFRIPQHKISPSHWQSVAMILKRGVGMSTLPCAKLRAIVDAAREISRLHHQEQGQDLVGGADDFLPIFIFCVVRADMERPCALCVLLRTLCDRINRIGEIGYFLASFEAAITHIQEIDLTEDQEDMLSFLTVPLTEVSLND